MMVLDDVDYGQLGAYGGPIETPNIDRLAATGLRHTNFHTTALCSPTRRALLTGRNHHSIGLAAITEGATGYPGNYGSIPKSAATVAEVLKQNGYNTLALLVSDNGASQEGLRDGTANMDPTRNDFPDTVEDMLQPARQRRNRSADPMGWAMVGNAPLKRWKQDTHAGGNTDPLIVSWLALIKDSGTLRRQYHHGVDVVPTLLEAAKLPAPKSVNGMAQMPLHATPMASTFDATVAPARKRVQYYEMLGSRAV